METQDQPQGSFWAARAVAFLYWTGWQAVVPFTALYATSLGAGPAAVGAILGGYSVVALLLSVPAGVLAERVGSGRMMFAGCFVGAVAALLIAAKGSLGVLVVGLTVMGLSQVMVSIGTQVETIRGAAQETMGRAMALYFFFSSTSQIAGPVVGALLVQAASYRTAFLGAGVLGVLAMLAASKPARRRIAPDRMVARPPAFEAIAEAIRHKPVARAGLLVSGMSDLIMAFWSAFFPLLLATRGYGPQAVAFYFLLRAVADTAARPVIWSLTARIAPRKALILSLVAGAASLAVMALVRSQTAISIAVVVFGGAVGMCVTLSAIDVTREFSTEAAGVGVGMRMLMSRVGIVLGPVLLGLMVEAFGYPTAFVVGAAISAGPVLLYGPRMRASLIGAAGSGVPARGGEASGREE